jgi:hypothetical protein
MKYLTENLLTINYVDPPECQAEVILQWWKVCQHYQQLLVCHAHLLIPSHQDISVRYPVLSRIALDYLQYLYKEQKVV